MSLNLANTEVINLCHTTLRLKANRQQEEREIHGVLSSSSTTLTAALVSASAAVTALRTASLSIAIKHTVTAALVSASVLQSQLYRLPVSVLL
jgi:hypothetical protein